MSHYRQDVNVMAWYRLVIGFTYLLTRSSQLTRLSQDLLMAFNHYTNRTYRLQGHSSFKLSKTITELGTVYKFTLIKST